MQFTMYLTVWSVVITSLSKLVYFQYLNYCYLFLKFLYLHFTSIIKNYDCLWSNISCLICGFQGTVVWNTTLTVPFWGCSSWAPKGIFVHFIMTWLVPALNGPEESEGKKNSHVQHGLFNHWKGMKNDTRFYFLNIIFFWLW